MLFNIREFIALQDTLEKKLFWLIIVIVEALSLVSADLAVLWKAPVAVVAGHILCAITFLEIMVRCKQTQKHRQCYVAMCLVYNCVLLPLTLFSKGGIHSSAIISFVLGIFLCVFCMDRKHSRICVLLSMFCMLGAICLSRMYPTSLVGLNLENAEIIRTEENLEDLKVKDLNERNFEAIKERKLEAIKEMESPRTIFDIVFTFGATSLVIVVISYVVLDEYSRQRHKEINNGIIDVLSTVVESRSVESGDHVMRIKGYTRILLKYANVVYNKDYTPEEIDVICSASAMHDIGKVAIPDSILLKPGRLTAEEYDIMKKHTVWGCDIINAMEGIQDRRYYQYSYEICRHHHERYDGNGYPDGLKGDDIPLAAQVVSVADVYDALVNRRCYKSAFTVETAYEMIVNGECGEFSPFMLECLRRARVEMEEFANTTFTNPLQLAIAKSGKVS